MRSRFLLALVLVAGCGGFQESGEAIGRITLDARGGTLTFHEMTIEVPPDALDRTVTLSARASAEPDALAAFQVTPDHAPLLLLATVSMTYAGIAATATDLHVVRREGAHWIPLHNRHETADRVSGQTDVVAVFGLARCPGGVCP